MLVKEGLLKYLHELVNNVITSFLHASKLPKNAKKIKQINTSLT